MTLPPDLVIFDCDGVLVDTEAVANAALARHITAAGMAITGEQSRSRFMGKTIEALRDELRAHDGIDLGDDFPERWRAGLPQVFAGGVDAIAGIAACLDRLQAAGAVWCVASAGSVGKMHLTLGSAGLLDRFADVLFSATMVARGKPAPDLFLHAAAQMGRDPRRCVVIEDSKFGAQGAQAAGMACYGYVGDPATDTGGLREAGAILFDDMAALPGLLGFEP